MDETSRQPCSKSAACLQEERLVSLFFVAVSVMGAALVLAGAPAQSATASNAFAANSRVRRAPILEAEVRDVPTAVPVAFRPRAGSKAVERAREGAERIDALALKEN